MNPTQDALEAQLGELTNWGGDEPELWRRSLSLSMSLPNRTRLSRISNGLGRIPSWTVGLTSVAAVFLALVSMLLEPLGASRISRFSPSSGDAADNARNRPAAIGGRVYSNDNTEWFPHHYSGSTNDAPAATPPADSRDDVALYTVADGGEGRRHDGGGRGGAQTAQAPANVPAAERHVVRKATIELTAADVRATFLKAGQLISEARNEYVQDSALTGTGNQLQANLTLRVAADRLPAVLNELRQLGEVRSERSDGQDVTTQVVDLEARLRNEQRIEAELLNLLETRKDAPLKEILDLRTNLGSVRNVIEQLSAQRQTLSRLVSLATILVIIRPPDAPVAPPPAGIGTYFRESVAAAWQKGLQVLADTLAIVLGAVVGGLPWWIGITAIVILIRAARRRKTRRTDP